MKSAEANSPADYAKDIAEQTELIRYLVDSETQSVTAFDSDLNTPLHYLEGARVPNYEAIELLRGLPDGEHAWSEMPNWYGFTAKELFEDAERVRARKDPWFKNNTAAESSKATQR